MDAISSTFRLNLMKSSIVKIAVIGSNSFSGASFVDFALANNLSVMGISRSEQPNDIFCLIQVTPTRRKGLNFINWI